MFNYDVALENFAKQALSTLRFSAQRDPQTEALGRERYLRQVRALRTTVVSRKIDQRKPGWITALKPAIAILMALVVLFSSAAVSVYAAQDSLPNEPFYALKLASEDARLALTLNDAAQITLLQQMTQTRVNEMLAMNSLGLPVSSAVATRLNLHLEQTLRLAARLEDPSLQQVMAQVQTQTQAQIRQMDQAVQNGDPVMQQTRLRLQEQLRLAELGQENPQQLRLQVQQRNQQQTGPTQTPNPQGTATPKGPDSSLTPGQGAGQPNLTQTPGSQGGGNGQGGQPTQASENGGQGGQPTGEPGGGGHGGQPAGGPGGGNGGGGKGKP